MKMRNAECGMRNGRGKKQRSTFCFESGAGNFRLFGRRLLPLRIPHSAFRTSAFTLVEILASLLFLAIAVPAIVGALGLASRTSEVAERGSLAGNLAENKLNEMLIDNAWQGAAQSNGDFGADFPFYRWQMSTQTWAGSNNTATGSGATSTTNTSNGGTGSSSLTELSIDVFYPVQGSEHSVRLTTLVNTSSTATGATTATGTSSSSTTTTR